MLQPYLENQVGWAVCVAHQGRHGTDRDGDCIVVGREAQARRRFLWTFGRCVEPGCLVQLDNRTDVATGTVLRLEAGTDQAHVCAYRILTPIPPEIVVTIDCPHPHRDGGSRVSAPLPPTDRPISQPTPAPTVPAVPPEWGRGYLIPEAPP